MATKNPYLIRTLENFLVLISIELLNSISQKICIGKIPEIESHGGDQNVYLKISKAFHYKASPEHKELGESLKSS